MFLFEPVEVEERGDGERRRRRLEEKAACFRKIFEERKRNGGSRRDNVTAEAARVLVKGERYTSSAIVPILLWSGMVRGDLVGASSSPRYSIFLNLGDGILEAIYQPLANIKPDRASSEENTMRRETYSTSPNKFEMLSELESAKFQCRDYELMPLKTIGKTLAARVHCVLKCTVDDNADDCGHVWIEASSGHDLTYRRGHFRRSETNVPLSMPTMMSEGVKTQAFMPSARARLRTYKLLLNAAQSEAIEMKSQRFEQNA